MIARVTLEIALRREFDYLIPSELESEIEVGTRVKVPFGAREVTGCVTALVDQSKHASLRPISKILGGQSFDWEFGDTLAAPAWSWIEHHASEDSIVFSMSDEALMRWTRYYRLEA